MTAKILGVVLLNFVRKFVNSFVASFVRSSYDKNVRTKFNKTTPGVWKFCGVWKYCTVCL